MRKAAHEGLSKSVVESFKTPQLHEAILLSSGLLAQPSTWDNHFRRTAASMIMSVTYDTPPIVSELNSSVKAVNDFVARLTRAALPGAHFVEFFPWMMYIPSRCGAFLTRLSTDLEVVLNDLDLQNGSVTQSIGMRETQLCSRTYSRA
jgi:hypothetical protein